MAFSENPPSLGETGLGTALTRYHDSGAYAQMLRLWTNPADVIAANKTELERRGESIVENLALCPLPVRLSYELPLSSEHTRLLGLEGINGIPKLTVVRDKIFMMQVYGDKTTGEEHVAVLNGIGDGENVPIRIHSSCLTAETFHASNCDCQEQLDIALNIADQEGYGGVIWLHQEGRGNGLAAKAGQLELMMTQGLNTVEAYEALGLPSEQRDFTAAAHILQNLGVKSVRLITNNPDKIEQTRALGIEVVDRIPCVVPPYNEIVRKDLAAKRDTHGHMFDPSL